METKAVMKSNGEHDCSAHNKKNGDYQEYQSLTHFIDEHYYMENGRKKSFSCKSKDEYRVCQCVEHDCSVYNKKNRHYYKYPSLTHFMEEY